MDCLTSSEDSFEESEYVFVKNLVMNNHVDIKKAECYNLVIENQKRIRRYICSTIIRN